MPVRYWFWLTLGLVWLGCSAPHDNPLDPASPHYVGPPPVEPVPVVLNAQVRSVHISRIFPTTDSYSVIAELDGQDAALLDSAWVSYDGGPEVVLSRTELRLWAAAFSASYFSGSPQLGDVIGRPFLFTSRDALGSTYETGPAYMWRVIEGVPLLSSPMSSDTIGPDSVIYRWQPFQANFPFNYKATVIDQTDTPEMVVWTSELLADTAHSIEQPDSLPDGRYYWTITVLDSFDNSSRSKEGRFVVDHTRVGG